MLVTLSLQAKLRETIVETSELLSVGLKEKHRALEVSDTMDSFGTRCSQQEISISPGYLLHYMGPF